MRDHLCKSGLGTQPGRVRAGRPCHPLVARFFPGALLWAFLAIPLTGGAQPDDRWRMIGQTASMRLYYDPSRIVREGEIRRVREIQDLAAPDPDGVQSRIYVNEYDCKNQMHRLGQMQSHAGPMLSGKRLFDVSEMGYWRRIPAGSVFAQVYQTVCPTSPPLPVTEPPPPLQRLFSPN